jgi:hypothetical protein
VSVRARVPHAALTRPGGQLSAQAAQPSRCAVLYSLSAHVAQLVAPRAEAYAPLGQPAQLAEPSCSANVPASHSWHAEARTRLE